MKKQKQKNVSPGVVIVIILVAIVLVVGVMWFQGRRKVTMDLSNVPQMPEAMKMKMKVQGSGPPVVPQGGQTQSGQ